MDWLHLAAHIDDVNVVKDAFKVAKKFIEKIQ
jgi:hypothetical protein